MMHFTLESASLYSIPEKNALNSQTFYSSILFQRPFLSTFRGHLSIYKPSLELCIPFTVYFCSFHTYVTSFTHVTLHFLCIPGIYSVHKRGEFHISHDASGLISVFSSQWKERSRVSREIFNDLNFKMQLIQGKFQ